MNSYYLWLDEHQQGPFTQTQLRQMWAAGRINLNTLFTSDSAREWKPLSGILCLLEPEPSPAAPRAKRRLIWRALRTLAGGAAILFLLGVAATAWLEYQRKSNPVAALEEDAYLRAEAEVRSRLPGAALDSISRAGVQRYGPDASYFQVNLIVDGRNLFNAPIRKQVRVDLRHDAVGFEVKEVKELP